MTPTAPTALFMSVRGGAAPSAPLYPGVGCCLHEQGRLRLVDARAREEGAGSHHRHAASADEVIQRGRGASRVGSAPEPSGPHAGVECSAAPDSPIADCAAGCTTSLVRGRRSRRAANSEAPHNGVPCGMTCRPAVWERRRRTGGGRRGCLDRRIHRKFAINVLFWRVLACFLAFSSAIGQPFAGASEWSSWSMGAAVGMARFGLVWRGLAWFGAVWLGLARFAAVWRGFFGLCHPRDAPPHWARSLGHWNGATLSHHGPLQEQR
jgi:hypothetical protein